MPWARKKRLSIEMVIFLVVAGVAILLLLAVVAVDGSSEGIPSQLNQDILDYDRRT